MKSFNHKLFYPLAIFSLTLLIYILVAGRFRFSFPVSIYNYFSHLAEAFLHGRLDLIHPTVEHDLSPFNGKLYTNWGPSPLLFILPIVALFGVNFSDTLYTAVISSFSPFFLFLTMQQLEKNNFVHISDLKKFILCLFFSFGTVHFSIAVMGGIWFTSQAINTLFMLIAIYLLSRYLNTKKNIDLSISYFFLGLAIWGRFTFIFYLPFFLTLIYTRILPKENGSNYLLNKTHIRSFVKELIFPSIILSFIFLISSIYNYARFTNIFDNGLIHHLYALKFASDITRWGMINVNYFPHNFYYMFINPPVTNFDPEGNSLLLLSPLLFLTFLIVRRSYWIDLKEKLFNSSIILSILLIVFSLLFYFSTGWIQFNYRYALDFLPLVILLLAEILADIPLIQITPLLIISIILNTLGAIWLIR